MPPEKISKITDATAGHVHPGWVGQHTGLLADDGSTPIRLPGAPPRPAFTPLTSTNVRLKKAQWGTANAMNEFVARRSFNDVDKGLFVAPPV